MFILYFTYNNYIKDNDISLALKSGGNKLLGLFLASLPGLIFLAIFLTKVTFFPSDNSYGAKELIKWINDARPLIVFDYAGEEIITEQFFHILLVLLILSFFLKNKANEVKQAISFKKADVFSIPILLAFVLLFIIPNGSGAGMMSDRFSLMIYILGLVWIVSRAVQSKFNVIAIVFVLVLHFGLLFKHLNGTIKNLDKDAQTIHYAANFVSNNSIVLPINLSDNWMEPHFSNYLGVDKPIIILENYEANVGWFPTRWNTDKLPNIMLGEKNSVCGITWYSNSEAKNIRQINNVLLYGDTRKLDDQNWEELKTILTNDFKLRYRSEDNYVLLFEKL